MNKDLITTGKFAKLARTTKRTVLFYHEIGLLKPTRVDKSGYRFYKQEQIIDFQIISLLRHLDISLDEIKDYLNKKFSLREIFELKKAEVENEINDLQSKLNQISTYHKNLGEKKNMIEAEIKKIKSFEIYYIVRKGPYAKIKDFCFELKNYFATIPVSAKFLTIYLEGGYDPEKAKMLIGVIKTATMKLSERGKEIVEQDKIPSYKALSYTFTGPGSLLSLQWEYLNEIKRKDHYKKDPRIPHGLEIYHKTSLNGELDENKHVFEIQIPVL